MTKKGQKKLLVTLCRHLEAGVLSKLKSIPDNWDGIELRRYVGDYYNENFAKVGDFSPARKRDYNNTLIVNNLT